MITGPAGPVAPAIDAAYGLIGLPSAGWEINVDGRPIARVRKRFDEWTVSGISDRKAREIFTTLAQAVEAATYRY